MFKHLVSYVPKQTGISIFPFRRKIFKRDLMEFSSYMVDHCLHDLKKGLFQTTTAKQNETSVMISNIRTKLGS